MNRAIGKYKCPCCGFYTFDEKLNGNYDICPVCFWEDDPIQLEDNEYEGGVTVPHDTVVDELQKVAEVYDNQSEDLSMAMAVYMLGFNTYMGFGSKMEQQLGEGTEGMLKRIYEYVKQIGNSHPS